MLKAIFCILYPPDTFSRFCCFTGRKKEKKSPSAVNRFKTRIEWIVFTSNGAITRLFVFNRRRRWIELFILFFSSYWSNYNFEIINIEQYKWHSILAIVHLMYILGLKLVS